MAPSSSLAWEDVASVGAQECLSKDVELIQTLGRFFFFLREHVGSISPFTLSL